MKCRKADIRKYGEQDMPYEVWAYEANDKAMITSLMEKLHNDPEIDVVLMDSPGSLKTEADTLVRQLGYHYCSISL